MRSLTRKELEILSVFWKNPTKELYVKDVIQSATKLNKNTVPVVIKKLADEGFLKPSSVQKVGKTFAQYYLANVSEDEYIASQFSRKGRQNLFAAFIQKDAKKEELEDLAELLQKKLEQLNEE
ncbi:BlaI/MecI/CopY family transcriptional regulator [Enterococcus columbae]|uniref:Penicillinase repressor n=1 Tax=Enterococcus columbae DSM 7374 = ATCC 51263 TaxID=1121865 RepID=S1NJZ4_9ENTE|nr:BlaI/MecI/CopY family transcriptional regulator [Enterococcus columbae]EOT41954.1 hypothetical protein OMW_01068 [Enterococcus columbae DSM 7374 = ATCC 51263]EOW80511.1 hypothetical protein I568_01688 [Enterococcus columbae DSM 7374 = ATCC 51263]OJG26413.1 hypothetical protein RR47_GL000161 [Enterococcus columbae DSM 7374 = ATCC 51263]